MTHEINEMKAEVAELESTLADLEHIRFLTYETLRAGIYYDGRDDQLEDDVHSIDFEIECLHQQLDVLLHKIAGLAYNETMKHGV